jgi:exosome complex RNA-binding protein Csl4
MAPPEVGATVVAKVRPAPAPALATRTHSWSLCATRQVTKVNPRFATVDIFAVNGQACREPFRGMVRCVPQQQQRQSVCAVCVAADGAALRRALSVQDIRATETDKVQVYRSFRPGDVILAAVISLGDARSYYLSTARNELGVIFAESEAGRVHRRGLRERERGRESHAYAHASACAQALTHAPACPGETMVPVSWQEMLCPKTQTKEFRKCAKPAAATTTAPAAAT